MRRVMVKGELSKHLKNQEQVKPKYSLPLEAVMGVEYVNDEDRKKCKQISGDVEAFKIDFDKT